MRRLDYSSIILGTGFVVLFFNSGTRYAFGLMLKPMTDDLGWSRSELTLALAAFMFVSALAMPLAGRLVDRYSLRLVLAGGALIGAAGIALTGRVTSQWQLFVAYGLVYAVGHAATSIPTVGVMINRWFTRRRAVANSAAISGNAIGQLVIITLLASFLTTLGWRTSYAVLGAANLAIVVPIVLAAARSRPPEHRRGTVPPGGRQSVGERAPSVQSAVTGSAAPGTLRSVLKSRQLWLLVVVYGVCGFQDFFVATHVVAFALDQGMGSVLAGNMLALMGILGLVGVLTSGVLADTFGATRPVALCFLIRLPVFAFVLYFQDTPAIIAFALLYGFTFLITAPLAVVFAESLFGPSRLGTVSGLINMVHQIGGGLGAFVGAVIFDRWGSYDGAFALMMALAAVAIAATLLLQRRVGKPVAAAEAR
ncbi:MAG: MFS transporter [Chloroflexi bacterium]|nr:MFS transporter [Chloroflexota bacterium]